MTEPNTNTTPIPNGNEPDPTTDMLVQTSHFNLLRPNPNITNYFYYKNALSQDVIERIRALVPRQELNDGNVSGHIDPSYRSSRIYWITKNPNTLWLYEKLMWFVKDANEKMWNFNISNVLEDIQFTEYDADYQGHYDWHMDVGGSRSSTRKVSLTIQLSDPDEYDGGELQFLINRTISEPERAQGTVVLFPSFLLHRVKKLTRGRRQSLVLWIHGQPFQ